MSGFAAIDRRAGRPADAAAVRARRRHRRAGHGVRRDDRAARARPPPARGPGRRPGDHRADPDRARRAAARRTTSSGSCSAHRQPLGQQRAAQHLPHRGRPAGSRSRPRRSRIAERVMRLVGRPELIDEPWFASRQRRGSQHADELDERRRGLDRRARPATRSSTAFEAAEAAVAPIYDVARRVRRPAVRRAGQRSRRSTTRTSARCGCRTCCSAFGDPGDHPMDRAPARRRYAYGARGAPRTRRADPRRSRRRPDRVRNT